MWREESGRAEVYSRLRGGEPLTDLDTLLEYLLLFVRRRCVSSAAELVVDRVSLIETLPRDVRNAIALFMPSHQLAALLDPFGFQAMNAFPRGAPSASVADVVIARQRLRSSLPALTLNDCPGLQADST